MISNAVTLDREPTVGVFVRVPERDMAELRRKAARMDLPVARLVRLIVHHSLAPGLFALDLRDYPDGGNAKD